MIVTDLHKTSVSGRHQKSQRKHEDVRTPTARNAIVRDRESGLYHANYDTTKLSDALNSINLRLNALELNQHVLHRQGVIATPDSVIAPAVQSNVIPMADARKAKEQSKVVPVSQPGNEAEQLPFPEVQDEVQVLPAPKPVTQVVRASNYEPTRIGKESTLTPSEMVPEATLDILAAVMPDEDVGIVEQLADAYGMDLVEASEILCREYFRREAECMKHHDKPRIDVKLARYESKRGMIIPGFEYMEYCGPRSENTQFKAWSREMRAREIELKGAAAARLADPPLTSAPYTQGEMAYRKKAIIHRAAARPKAHTPGFAHVQKVSKELAVPPAVTTASQIAAIGAWTWDVYQKGRKLVGMNPTVRHAAKRTRYELMDAVNNFEGNNISPRSKVAVPCDDTIPQAELVRRYRRTGIGY